MRLTKLGLAAGCSWRHGNGNVAGVYCEPMWPALIVCCRQLARVEEYESGQNLCETSRRVFVVENY